MGVGVHNCRESVPGCTCPSLQAEVFGILMAARGSGGQVGLEVPGGAGVAQVNMVWMPRHFGVRGGKEMDKLAWRGTEMNFMRSELAEDLPFQSVKKKVNDWVHRVYK